MKYLMIVLSLLGTLTVHAQQNIEKANQHSSIIIKTNPMSLLMRHAKIGVDISLTTQEVLEFQGGMAIRENSSPVHMQIKYKRFMTDPKRMFTGIYLAPGIDVGYIENNKVYSTAFVDGGFQLLWKGFSFELFGGLGYLVHGSTAGDEPAAGCMGCGLQFTPNAFHIEDLALRHGIRIGVTL